MSLGIDYAFFPHPPLTAMKTTGVKFVCRYVSPEPRNDTNGKNLVPSECSALLNAGFQIVLVYEPGDPQWMLGGKAAGVAAAQDFDAVASVLRMPGIVMYGAADFDATPDEQTPINACLNGMASVLGLNRTGIYGGYYPVTRALAAAACSYAWQTLAWSGGQWNAADGIRQGLQITVGGVSVDIDTSMGPDFGQWPRPAGAAPGPYRHLIPAGFNHSIDWLAAARNTTVDHLVARSLTYCNSAHQSIINAYMAMRAGLKAVGEPSPVLPEGFVYYTVNP